jgi:translation initiation factor 2B subunit (eIF-2B alpha/beta/delta family)
VLLGADRISPEGDVSNKIGSLSAAVMAKRTDRQASAKVVVVSDTDKIVGENIEPGGQKAEMHPASELMDAWAERTRTTLKEKVEQGSVEVFGEWFEWVPAQYIDAYVTDGAVYGIGDLKNFSREIGELSQRILT